MSATIQDVDGEKDVFWKESSLFLISFSVLTALFVVVLYPHGLGLMVDKWFETEEYSHGIMIPFVSAFLIWQKKNILERIPFSGSWAGAGVVLVGAILILLGNISTLTIFIHYGFVITLGGLFLAYMGWRGLKEILVPLFLLFLAIPLPGVISQDISQTLQLISSSLGVWVIRLFNISVYLEGNVIDLGTYKLQVVEACSGLRYLFPLMTLGLIAAYFYKVAFWKRVFVFLSSIPITIVMNSFRIGVIGVLVEYWGQSMAEGFLHDFEGWVVFMACTGVLVLEMWVLAKIGGDGRPLSQVFGLTLPTSLSDDVRVRQRPISKAYWTTTVILLLVMAGLVISPAEREDVKIARKKFSDFPMMIGDWQGKPGRIEQIYLDVLKLDDYLMVDYANQHEQVVNLYIAYYASQSKGNSIHSPRACLPGGGWQIREFSQKEIVGIGDGSQPLRVNRAGIQLGESRQLTYYWFQMHGRSITNEYLLKWYIFADALTLNKTDGALIRLITPLRPDESFEDADNRLISFIKSLSEYRNDYVPD
ncbi:MAG: VPLPA-CTERM-specific exosortase XrtD [Sulfuricaulis sp.]